MIFLQQVTEFVQGRPIENAHPAIEMFSTASNMNWAHLPVAGGIYDQDPELLRRWRIIWGKQAEKERAEQKKQKAEASRRRTRGR